MSLRSLNEYRNIGRIVLSIKIVSELLDKDAQFVQDRQSDVLIDIANLKVQRMQGKLERPWSTNIRVRPNHLAVKFNIQGSLLIRDIQGIHQFLAPEQSVICIKGPAEIPVDFSRGNYDHYIFSWNMAQTAGLAKWIEAMAVKLGKTESHRSVYVGSSLISHITKIQDRMLKVCHSYGEVAEPLVLGALHEMAVYAVTAKNEINLTSLPTEIPSFLKLLLRRVKKSPQDSWSLKEASALAGYSPFHLSRTFKAHIGYGFPEFVDRCRVERAVQYLLSGNYSIDRVAAVCGYSSTHGLREAMKEYVGFLPSELRSYALISTSEHVVQESQDQKAA